MSLFGTVSAGNDLGMKNRIINGAMNIFQRAATTTQNTTATLYALDQWAGFGALTDGVYTMTQASATPPTGFTNYLRATITTADSSIGAGQSYGLRHCIEGYNTTDLGWGASGASSITISFWARSSVTGTYPVTVVNDVLTRSYLFTFSLVANTWTYVTQTITGDITGTWEKTTSSGIKMFFGLGYGSNYLGTTGSWQTTTSSTYLGTATGCTALIATNGATFDVTGVQLEKGSTATSFDYRPYGTELALCQRYFQSQTAPGYLPALCFSGNRVLSGVAYTGPMRATPAFSVASTSFTFYLAGAAWNSTVIGASPNATGFIQLDVTVTASSGASGVGTLGTYTLSAEL